MLVASSGLFSCLQALDALDRFPSPATREALIDIVKNKECFYKIRQDACYCLAKVNRLLLR